MYIDTGPVETLLYKGASHHVLYIYIVLWCIIVYIPCILYNVVYSKSHVSYTYSHRPLKS